MVRTSRTILALVSVSLVLAAGCQSWHAKQGKWSWRGPGYDDDVNALTQNLRPPGNERKFSGIDARARDIERNLGVR